jgi:hypothetical protein
MELLPRIQSWLDGEQNFTYDPFFCTLFRKESATCIVAIRSRGDPFAIQGLE